MYCCRRGTLYNFVLPLNVRRLVKPFDSFQVFLVYGVEAYRAANPFILRSPKKMENTREAKYLH